MMVVAVVVISTVVDLNLLDVFEPRMLELARRTLTDHVLLMLIQSLSLQDLLWFQVSGSR